MFHVMHVHGNIITRKRFLYYWLFIRGIHHLPMDSLHIEPEKRTIIFGVSTNKLLKTQVRWQLFEEPKRSCNIPIMHISWNANHWFKIKDVSPRSQWVNSLRPRQMDAISQTTFSNAFSWMKMLEFRLKFHWRLFPRVQLTISQHWFR